MANWLNNSFNKIDFNIAKLFHLLEVGGGKFTTTIMKMISYLGQAGIFIIIIALLLLIWKKTRKCGANIILSLALGYIITSLIIKPLVERSRPFSDITSDYFTWWVNAGKVMESGYSFPSGHTCASMTFATSLFLCSKNKKISWLIFLFPILMAISRTYLMVHYFSDCLGAILVGLLMSIIAYYIIHLIFDKTKGKFHNFVNNFSFTSIFKKKNNKPSNKNNNITEPINDNNSDTDKEDTSKIDIDK